MLLVSSVMDLSLTGITVNAASSTIAVPTISTKHAYSNKIEMYVKNIKKFNNDIVFDVYVNGDNVKSVSYSSVKKTGYIGIYYSNKEWFKSNTTYRIQIKAKKKSDSAKQSKSSKVVSVKTDKNTYYCITKGSKYYSLKSKKFINKGRLKETIWEKGKTANESGVLLAGKSRKIGKETYVRIESGKYKGYYVKLSETPKSHRIHETTALRRKVCTYARGMNGGRYVSCGTSYRATDCSGLTMLAYKQIGINLPHSAAAQASRGKTVSRNKMQPGDIIICNNYGHAMLYLGDGYLIHAMNSRDGIRIQKASVAMAYNPVNKVVRLV